jgi:hypothetical protein
MEVRIMLGVNRWTVVAATAGLLAGGVPFAASARAEHVRQAGEAAVAVAASDGPNGAAPYGNDSDAVGVADDATPSATPVDRVAAAPSSPEPGPVVPQPAPAPLVGGGGIPAPPVAAPGALPPWPSFAPVTVTNTTTIIVVTAPITVANGAVTTGAAPPTPVVPEVPAPRRAAPSRGQLPQPTAKGRRSQPLMAVLMATRPDEPGAPRHRVRPRGALAHGPSAVRRGAPAIRRRPTRVLHRHWATGALEGWAHRLMGAGGA